MEYKVFKLVVTVTTDWGMRPSEEEVFNGLFASKIEAIRQAQRRFAKQPLNDYANSVWAVVYPLIIADKGTTQQKRIYNLYKTL